MNAEKISLKPGQLAKIGELLCNFKIPMKARYRALFTLKAIGGDDVIDIIANNFTDESNLLKHEMAYCLGQMQNDYSLQVLRKVIRDTNQHVIVRHEAAEALGAIGRSEDEKFLSEFSNDSHIELAETCQIAADRIKWLKTGEKTPKSDFNSVDPAPPLVDTDRTVSELRSMLVNTDLSLFERYRAMFSLRNISTEQSVLAICDGFSCDSALFRHEVAYVLGQLAHPASESHLTKYLVDVEENGMVRHECAEALGAIGTQSAISVLEKYLSDSEPLVRESCEVALDMSDYMNSKEFQYADALQLTA